MHTSSARPGPQDAEKNPQSPQAFSRVPAEPWKDPFFWAITGLAAILLFWNLDGRCLWQDEAETALLAKSIIRTGLPYAWNGTNLISQEGCREFGDDYLWRWSPWIQFYLAAGSMKLFGETEVAARLPFVIIGLATVPLVYVVALRLFGSKMVARLSALFLAFSVTFLLHARQARWHAPAYFLAACLVLTLLGMSQGKRSAVFVFVASAVLLWYTNFYVTLGLLLALIVAAPVLRFERSFLIRLAISLCVIGFLVLPSYFFFVSFRSHENNEAAKWHAQLLEYSGELFTFLLPMPAIGVIIYRMIRRQRVDELAGDWKCRVSFLLILCLIFTLYLSVGPWRMFRYLTLLLPVASILVGLAVCLLGQNPQIRGVVVAILLFTNFFHKLPLGYVWVAFPGTTSTVEYFAGWPQPKPTDPRRLQTTGHTLDLPMWSVGSPFWAYLKEIREPVEDTELIVAKYLNRHAKPDDVVLVSYGDLTLKFYTQLKIRGGMEGRPLPGDPDWYLPRHRIVSYGKGKDASVIKFMNEKLFDPNSHLLKDAYQDVNLRGKDIVAANCPEPRLHCYTIPPMAGPIHLIKKHSGPSVRPNSSNREAS